MGIRGVIRSIEAANRRYEREAKRRQRELEKERIRLLKEKELLEATYEVEIYENYIEVITSIHKDCSDDWDWKAIYNSLPPEKPQKNNNNEVKAYNRYHNYKPTFLDKILFQANKIKESLYDKIEEEKFKDENIYKNNIKNYNKEFKEWEKFNRIATKIINQDTSGYLEAIKEINPFYEISDLGTSIKLKLKREYAEITIDVKEEKIVPKKCKKLLKSGKLSIKDLTKTKFYEIYQDYVCGVILRVARELFAILPIDNLYITSYTSLLNTKNGQIENTPILSVYIPRKTLDTFNFELVDPSDSMENFKHNMNFKKTKGFCKVDKIVPENDNSSNNKITHPPTLKKKEIINKDPFNYQKNIFIHEIRVLQANINKFFDKSNYFKKVKTLYSNFFQMEEDYNFLKENYKNQKASNQLNKIVDKVKKLNTITININKEFLLMYDKKIKNTDLIDKLEYLLDFMEANNSL